MGWSRAKLGFMKLLLPAAMAVARFESFWELPVLGRFLVPPADQDETVGVSRNR